MIIHKYFQNETNSEIIKNSLDNIFDLLNKKQVANNKYLEILKLTNYVDKDNQIIVPVFDNYIHSLHLRMLLDHFQFRL